MRRFLHDWLDAMPNTITGLCSVGVIACALVVAAIVTESETLSLSAMVFSQVGTFAALGGGFVLDKRRMDRRNR